MFSICLKPVARVKQKRQADRKGTEGREWGRGLGNRY